MKHRMIVLLLFASVLPLAFGDGATAQSQNQPGFGLQATIFSSVRAPSTNVGNNISLIENYPPTPGDVYTLTIGSGVTPETGSVTQTISSFPIQLGTDMKLDVPFIGSVNVEGKTLLQLRKEITAAVRRSIPVQYVNFALSTPAEFDVFVYGGVNSPGYVVANPMTSVVDAIGLAKGFKAGASYRSIDLVHDGKTQVLDLAKFYMDADFAQNPRLTPGDTLYVPAAQIVTTITGNVKFPGVYELLPSETLQTLVNLAGGFTPGALTSRIEIARIDPQGVHHLVDVSDSKADAFHLIMGDQVNVLSTTQNAEMVTIEGAVFGTSRSGDAPVTVPQQPVRIDVPFFPGISLLTVLDSVGGPTPFALTDRSYIVERTTGKRVSVDVAQLWKTREASLDVALEPGDQIVIPMQTLKVFVTGQVPNPGAEPYQPDLTVADYLLLAGGIDLNTADPNGIFKVTLDGSRTKLSPHDIVPPGTNIFVNQKPLFAWNQSMQNFFLATGWITGILGVIGAVLSFAVTYQPSIMQWLGIK